jgi:parallel beta-helix repeat protein
MKNVNLLLIFSFLLLTLRSLAQSVSFPDDEKERGYYTRPYLRYEAEAGKCETNGAIFEPTYVQTELQSEASNQTATQLIAKDSYIQWTNEKAADGLTIRFSLPDNAEGKGTKGKLALYVNDNYIQDITLDSYWAWQYFLGNMSNPYPDNTPDANTKFPRMRFDEKHVKLDNQIPAGAIFKLVKTDDNDSPYTIDFVELESIPAMVTFESIPDENKIEYSPDKGKLGSFISSNGGKTIYIPSGKYDVDTKITISGDNTKLIGAGMWHTEIYFTASSDERSTYSRRGIETQQNNIVVEGLFLNTVNNKRYYDNDSRYQVGKGLMGSFGSNSVIRNVWAEHFECGAWIDGASNLTVTDCRFRNNYADGINLSYGSKNSVVEYSSFRNNGDDDIATWSRDGRLCENNTFRYCTIENNWRASGLGFFGGKQNTAHNIVIIDPMEAGFRVTCDFDGAAFDTEGYSEFRDISVYKAGTKSGNRGVNGDLWGNRQGAVHINSTTYYDLQNIKISNINIYDSKDDAVFIGSGSKSIQNLIMENIHINGAQRYGIFFNNTRGTGQYCNIEYLNTGAATNTNTQPSAFSFIEHCDDTSLKMLEPDLFKTAFIRGTLVVSGFEKSSVSVYDISGRKKCRTAVASNQTEIPDLNPGVYVVRLDKNNQVKKVLAR